MVTGATGSGKSTTLAAMIDHINTYKREHILTIEDPIEFVHHNKLRLMNQREVHRDTKSFSNALGSALREDPDVILVGELRDLETTFSNSAGQKQGTLCLVRRIPILRLKPSIELSMYSLRKKSPWRALCCLRVCGRSRTKRRRWTNMHEIMFGVPAIRVPIREDKVPQMYSVIQTGWHGMQTMEQANNVLLYWLISPSQLKKSYLITTIQSTSRVTMHINDFFQSMIAHDASDLFITVGRPVSAKINGSMTPLNETDVDELTAKRLLEQVDNRAKSCFS